MYWLALWLALCCTIPSFAFIVDYTNGGFDRIFESNSSAQSQGLENGDQLVLQDCLTTGPRSFAQVSNSTTTLRVGKDCIIHWLAQDHWKIYKGSVLFCLEDKTTLGISSTKGECLVTGPCTFIAEATSNGGYKFICLSGKPTLRTGKTETKIPSGRLVLVLGETNELGNSYDIDLLLLLKSSFLINAFETPPPTMKKIGLAVYSQQLRIKNKYNALIGDAPTDKNLQMWVPGSSQNKKEE